MKRGPGYGPPLYTFVDAVSGKVLRNPVLQAVGLDRASFFEKWHAFEKTA
jgi:hypothetical protein